MQISIQKLKCLYDLCVRCVCVRYLWKCDPEMVKEYAYQHSQSEVDCQVNFLRGQGIAKIEKTVIPRHKWHRARNPLLPLPAYLRAGIPPVGRNDNFRDY